MDLGIKNKLALITGSGRGLGEGIALALAKEGCRVVAVSRTQDDLDKLRDKIDCYTYVCDLMPEGEPTKLYNKIKNDLGDIEILVNNCGGNLNISDPLCSIAEWKKVYRFNLEIAIELNNLVIPDMKEKSWGRICHVSSISGREIQGSTSYGSMKAALNLYTRSIGRMMAKYGIVINAALPGACFTEGGWWDNQSKNNPEHVKKYLKERMAIGRFGKVEEVANVVAFLCSQHSSFMTGSLVNVEGGQGLSL